MSSRFLSLLLVFLVYHPISYFIPFPTNQDYLIPSEVLLDVRIVCRVPWCCVFDVTNRLKLIRFFCTYLISREIVFRLTYEGYFILKLTLISLQPELANLGCTLRY
jgi:hypothetical protein